jgi:hypothetical protein
MGVAFLATSAAAQAQYGYPAGYGGYGFGGWGGGGGQTPQGDMARGMGVFAAGAGYYNQSTAVANSINANTAMNWNEYLYQSQQAVNRKYYAKLAARQKENVKANEDIYKRLRDNPSQYDIYRGDAMNVIFDELCSPKVYIRGLKSSTIKFPGEMIRDVPFNYAQSAITNTVHQIMTKGSAPAVLRRDVFKPENEQMRAIGAKIREEDEKNGTIDPETLDEADVTLKKLQVKVAKELAPGSKDRLDADRFLKSALGLSKMLRTPAINVLLSGVDKHPETTVADLMMFMKSFNLRFGVADVPRERQVYDELYPLMVRLRDEAFPRGKPELTEPTEGDPAKAADFFEKMDEKAVDPKAVPPAPKPQ